MNYNKLDWSKTYSQLSKETGVSIPWLCQMARRLGVKKRRGRPFASGLISDRLLWIKKVDWSTYDAELARQVGRTRERIRQVRKELGLTSSRFIKKPTKQTL